MRLFLRAVVASLLIVLLAAPAALFADQLLLPRDVVILPGVTTIEYGGHAFVFTTNAQIKAKFRLLGNTVEMRVKAVYNVPSSGEGATSVQYVNIYWNNQDETVYEGTAEEWIELLFTEGGFTEK